MTLTMASLISLVLPGLTKIAASPPISGSEVVSERMTGVPHLMASAAGIPKPSNHGTKTKAEAEE